MSTLDSTILGSVTGGDNQLITGTVGVAVILATTVVYYAISSKEREHDFPKLRGIQLYHAWNFFQRRYDFLQSNFKRNFGKSFSFNVLHHNVVALTGEEARQAFYSNPHLDLGEGYKILMGAAPRVSNVDMATEESEDGDRTLFNKVLNKLLNKARIQDVLPTLLQDIVDKADRWGNDGAAGRIDPFTEIYGLVFLMTARMTTCHDLTKNEVDLKKIGDLFLTLQTSATPTSLLLPWFPSPARKAGRQATTELYTMLYGYVERRKHARPTNDAIDVLIADGETTQNIMRFVMAMLFVGIINTGIISCWMLIDLAIHTEWKEKCKKEIQDLLSRHLDDSLSSVALHEKLRVIPVSAWEDELPILEACIRESQRIVLSNVALRRNIHEEIRIGKQVVKRGDFLVYSLGDVHLNPEYYPEPHKYDPGRWLRPDPVPDAIYPFLGWGAGRHPCVGMKVAKLEMKLILAMFLTRYEFDLVDKDGKFPDPLPVPNRNDVHQARPLGATYYFDFKKIVQ
ncbi:cytochrome P450 [Thelephora ganbajun]|uniref:Cytochrome P450 n=1 Tax=Thelephora ganbajun TaxID=370292 RepID=A0ACB6Z5S0_THEGA|nr:cytochrome P450 [Thelephora ganbajun]